VIDVAAFLIGCFIGIVGTGLVLMAIVYRHVALAEMAEDKS
jgi:hypothetical protein